MNSQPVFYDPHGRRKRVLSRSALIAIAASVGISFVFGMTVLIPILPSSGEKKAKHGILPQAKLTSRAARNLELEKKRLANQITKDAERSKPVPFASGQPIVAAFYAPWQETGLYSLEANKNKITHLMPEWVHLRPDGKSLDFETDFDPIITPRNKQVIQIAEDAGIRVFPILNNASGGEFDQQRVKKLLDSEDDQAALGGQLRDWLQENKFAGINLDFEKLDAADYKRLPAFVQRLRAILKPAGLKLTADLEADNDNVPMRQLADLCDWVVLMAYDKHDEASEAGPIAPADWSEQVINLAKRQVPASKLVCGIGNYAYDWIEGQRHAESITYQEALIAAADNRDDEPASDVIRLDPQSLNPTFDYVGEDNRKHSVWMLDGVTAYNKWKLAQRSGLRGAAVWALGSEDPTIWTFFDRNKLNVPANPSSLETVEFPYGEVEYQGDGEILKVKHDQPESGRRKLEIDPKSGLIVGETYQKYPSSIVIKQSGRMKNAVALTFDDGPDEQFTPQILDVLKDQGVKATFFVIGKNAEQSAGLVRRIVDEGHEIGNHSFTHPNLGTASQRRLELEINATQRAIESITGRSTILFRPPYNADAMPTNWDEVRPVLEGSKMGYITVGELIDPEDWLLAVPRADGTLKRRTAADITSAIYADLDKGNVILLHDAGGDRSATVQALRTIIPALKARGYRFVTVSQLAGMTYDQVMPPIPANQRAVIWLDRLVFDAVFGSEAFLAIAFLLAIGLGLARIALTTPLAVFYERVKSGVHYPDAKPSVGVLIAAYNEQTVIARTIRSVLASDYAPYEIIVVDDGSHDDTSGVVQREFANNPIVKLIRQDNAGKAAALNHAIDQSVSEILVCVDADTQLDSAAIGSLARHFTDDEVAAVAGNVRVGNEINLLTRWQSIEYTTSQNLDRRAYALLNAITVVPGAISAWRRSVLLEVGGYSSDTLAEDTDLTWRVRERGYQLETDSSAIAYTEAPDSFRPFFKQRFRWAYGTLQCLWKHKRTLFKHGFFGWLALPTLWMFQVVFQALAPLVDIQLLYSAWGFASAWLQRNSLDKDYQPLSAARETFYQVLFLYILFFAFEMFAALIAYRLEKRKAGPVLWLFWQRFVYRQIMYAVIYKAFATALGGVRQGWGKIERKATVNMPTNA